MVPWYASPEWWLVILGFPTIFFVAWQAIATRQAAVAAQASTDVVINSERAWISADISFQTGAHIFDGTSGNGSMTTGVYVELMCSNQGKSPAWIIEKRAAFRIVKELPQEPDMSSAEIIQHEPEPMAAGASSTYKWSTVCEGRHGPHTCTLLYGIVKYRDIFEKERETRFGYFLTVNNELERLAKFPRYNLNT